jgi:Mn2+/Fe2+ NRAMP family transporter
VLKYNKQQKMIENRINIVEKTILLILICFGDIACGWVIIKSVNDLLNELTCDEKYCNDDTINNDRSKDFVYLAIGIIGLIVMACSTYIIGKVIRILYIQKNLEENIETLI